MTPNEFKSWFEGFSESISGIPNKEQWKKIKIRVLEINGKPVTFSHYIEKYYLPYCNYPNAYLYSPYATRPDYGGGGGYSWCYATEGSSSASSNTRETINNFGNMEEIFNSERAMYYAGKSEASAK